MDTWSAVADATEVRLELVAPGGQVLAWSIPGGVEQILDNLIDNAVEVAPQGSRVSVTIVKGAGTHQLIVADEGPGLSDADKARALERFWRADRSAPGTGLGLPIAAAFAKAAGGGLVLGDGPAGGLSVSVTLPAAPRVTDRR